MWKELAADITRQRLIIEGTLHTSFKSEQMVRYCDEITKVLDMTRAAPPSCHYNKKYGWCTYMPWVESGMHCYGWDHRNPPFFSIDLYTCKAFEPIDAVEFTQKFFGEQLINIVWKE